MIKLKIGNAGHETDIRFPISESDLYDRLLEILAIDIPDQQPPVTVTGVYWPEEFSVLEGRQVNLDEMNYLAKRMESFDALEMDQFLICPPRRSTEIRMPSSFCTASSQTAVGPQRLAQSDSCII